MTNVSSESSVYRGSPLAVLPGVVLRGSLLGVVYAVFTYIFLYIADGPGEESLPGWIAGEELLAPPLVGYLVGGAFLIPFLTVVIVAVIGYRRRQYRIGPDGITIRRGVFSTSEQTLPWEEVDDVTFVQSFLQSHYGAGTIRLSHIDTPTVGDSEKMRIRYVENPEAVWSEIRSVLVSDDDAMATDGKPFGDAANQAQYGDLSSLSGDMLAAETSSTYQMPLAITRPNGKLAARDGFLLGLTSTVFLTPTIFILGLFVLDWLGLFSLDALSALAFVSWASPPVAVAGLYFVRMQRVQYEFYRDHVRAITSQGVTTIRYRSIGGIERRYSAGVPVNAYRNRGRSGSGWASMALVLELIGSLTGEDAIGISDGDGNVMVVLKYLDNADEVSDFFQETMATVID